MSELSLPRILFSLSLPLSLLSPSDIDACVSCLFIYSPPSVSRARVFSPYFLFPVNETLSPAITGCLSGSPFAIKRPGRREEGEGSHEKEEEEEEGENSEERNVANEISWKRAVFINPPLPFNRPLKDNQDRVVLIRDHCIF